MLQKRVESDEFKKLHATWLYAGIEFDLTFAIGSTPDAPRTPKILSALSFEAKNLQEIAKI